MENKIDINELNNFEDQKNNQNSMKQKSNLKCEQCEKIFKHASSFYRHRSEQHKLTQHVNCQICDKIFYRNTKLKQHLKYHANDRKELDELLAQQKFLRVQR